MTYQGYLIDLDGTMYLGNEKIPAAKPFIERLQAKKIPFMFVTNNTTKTPSDVSRRLADSFDIHVSKEHVYTATLATVDYMKKLNKGNSVYIIGESGLKEGILKAGFIWEEKNPDYVVVGLDTELTYEKLKLATFAIQNGAFFIGTNPDKNIPTGEGLAPGAGSLISLLETATRVNATYIGKPEAIIMESALQVMDLPKKEVIMVGDNYETDIQAGIRNGIDTLLVLTGFTSENQVPLLPEAPTHVVSSLDEWII